MDSYLILFPSLKKITTGRVDGTPHFKSELEVSSVVLKITVVSWQSAGVPTQLEDNSVHSIPPLTPL